MSRATGTSPCEALKAVCAVSLPICMRHLIRFYSGEGKPTLFFRAPTSEFGTLELSGEQDINFSGFEFFQQLVKRANTDGVCQADFGGHGLP